LGLSSNAASVSRCQQGGLLSAPSGLAGYPRDEPQGCNGDQKTSSTQRHALAQQSLHLGQPRGAHLCDELPRPSSLEWDRLSNHFHGGLRDGHARSNGDLLESQIYHGDLREVVRIRPPWNRGGQCMDPCGANAMFQFTFRA